jgi:hypothetical protein
MLMGWKKKPEPSMRDQLVEARAKLQRQIEIMSVGTIRGWGYQPGSQEELESELHEINDALANLEPDDA